MARDRDSQLQKRDYRTVRKANLTMQDVLVFMISSKRTVMTSDVVKQFNVGCSDAAMRLFRLWKYSLATRIKKNLKRSWGYEYRVSSWGYKYARDQKLI